MAPPQETDLYAPLKAFLETQGYDVKAEIGAADLVAVRGDEPPVIVELKLGFSLTLVHQCVARLSITEAVYMAVSRGRGRRFQASLRQMTKLCRRLGLGLITVRLGDGLVQVHCDPAPYAPKRSVRREALMLREFARRNGDPNTGGQVRRGLITAYRQDCMRIALYLYEKGASKGAAVAEATGVGRATRMMRDDHYGWFRRIATGVYELSPKGVGAVMENRDKLPTE